MEYFLVPYRPNVRAELITAYAYPYFPEATFWSALTREQLATSLTAFNPVWQITVDGAFIDVRIHPNPKQLLFSLRSFTWDPLPGKRPDTSDFAPCFWFEVVTRDILAWIHTLTVQAGPRVIFSAQGEPPLILETDRTYVYDQLAADYAQPEYKVSPESFFERWYPSS